MQVTIKRGKEDLISTGGNHLCGHWLKELSRKHLPVNFQKRKSGGISDRDCLLTMTGILCNARADFNDVDQYKDDRVFSEAFGIKDLPSEPTLRQRLDDLPPERTQATLRKLNLALLKDRNFKTVRAGHLDLVPVDIDVSPFDNSGSNKQGVSLTYKKHLGFAPIFAYIGAQGYMLDHELGSRRVLAGIHPPKSAGPFLRTLRDRAVFEFFDLRRGRHGVCLIVHRRENPRRNASLRCRILGGIGGS